MWCEKLNEGDCTSPAEDALPPLDVLMVWHAYMLNPRWYAEDCTRITSLKALSDFTPVFSNSFSSNLNEILTSEPTPSRIARWKETGTPFDLLQEIDIWKSRIVLCPKCKHPTTTPYITPEGTGFFQPNFSIKCSNEKCMGPPITKMTLGARRFVEDLARTSAESGEVASSLPIMKMMTAYEGCYVFSVELVGAVIRQGSFVTKMHDLQWTQPHFFDSKEDEVALQHSIARYHAFLDLMSASPVSFYVPTLDIDLAWHTHQLLGKTYHDDCLRHVGRFIDQSRKIRYRQPSTLLVELGRTATIYPTPTAVALSPEQQSVNAYPV
ncbi:hypothetical protein H0H93_015560 [Arthromyces matolae]|nr:hypothetical protein H0H93_015560 [Arthromyces matolae]